MGGLRSRSLALPVFALVYVILVLHGSSQSVVAQSTCSSSVLLSSGGSPKVFQNCTSLPKLGASLAWSFNQSNRHFEFAFQATLPDKNGWAGWGVRPSSSPSMPGASAFIAFNGANGTNVLPYLLQVTPTNASKIDLEVIGNLSAIISGLEVTFGGTLRLKQNQTVLNQLWNVGSSVIGYTPQQHALSGENAESLSELDLSSGSVTQTKVANIDLKNKHGIINGLAWGIMFPMGILAARYMRPFKIFDPLWFYLHVFCQVSAYILGVAGWGTGLRLGSLSESENDTHQSLATAMFTLATLQMTALILRPKPGHKYRKYWNIYHHMVGYTLIIISIVNVFKGIDILSPANGWKVAFVVIIITIAGIALILEIVTWTAWFVERKRVPPTKLGLEDGQATRPAIHGQDNANHQWVADPQL
ncbi:hypothetical protein R1flu_007052 [Riccia fluitans]|uniref:Cytochrome b561 and DOMON domain-containing protein n=1 Tax=Riccia fluitans TaxID=41844 RepID=A0ABD1YYC3_9MARC